MLRWLPPALLLAAPLSSPAQAQESELRYGAGVPSAVRMFNERALAFLAATQDPDGSWPGEQGRGSGVVGICVMALLASGEDPDYGPYADNVRRALQYMIRHQSAITGPVSGPGHGPMYHHGLATLALSEAYGSVSELLLWEGSDAPPEARRSLGQSLELAVRCILTSQRKNPWKAWRYSADGTDADTTVSGTVLMGLLGARNAGIEVPNRAIDDAITYFESNTLQSGLVTYQAASSHGDGVCRAAIATLVYSIAKRKDSQEYAATSTFIKKFLDQDLRSHPFYTRYYMAQALFQSDLEVWRAWNARVVKELAEQQQVDGSIESSYGPSYGTAMSVLALALNYRLLPVYER